MVAYDRTDYMYEKYDAFRVGHGGGGGEYVPQKGFGWSNGVALMLLSDMYPATASGDSSGGSGEHDLPGWQTALIVLAVVALFAVACFVLHRLHHSGQGAKTQEASPTAAVVNLHTENVLNAGIAK